MSPPPEVIATAPPPMTPQEWIAKALADAPPLTDHQRTQLAELLRPVMLTVADRAGGVK